MLRLILFADDTNLFLRDINILIDNADIERVYSTKFLVVIIDSKLTWKEHISTVKSKLSKCLAILYKSSKILESDSLRTLYCTFFNHIKPIVLKFGVQLTNITPSVYQYYKKNINNNCKKSKKECAHV